jgi:hypothetical protein
LRNTGREYQTNLLLILLLLGGLCYATNRDLIIPFTFLGAVLVYFDAENIRAGEKFEKVSLPGEVSTWRPIVWAVAVFIGTSPPFYSILSAEGRSTTRTTEVNYGDN